MESDYEKFIIQWLSRVSVDNDQQLRRQNSDVGD